MPTAPRVKSTLQALSKMPPRPSGRLVEDRPDPISIYQLKRGTWTCKCGSENKVSLHVCPRKLGGTPCGRPAPFLKVCVNIPIQIALPFMETNARQGNDLAAGIRHAIDDFNNSGAVRK